jgi:hypothetical protein
MGDFNDDPVNESIKKDLGTYGEMNDATDDKFYNPMEPLNEKGIGTLAYNDNWNLFDQIILNRPWLPTGYASWQYYAVRVFNKPFMKADHGNYRGTPFHTYSGGVYTGGYSDHFPVFIVIAKENVKKIN